MIVNTKAIVVSTIKYNDTSLIVKCLTLSDGIRSYLLKGVLNSKKGKLRTAYFQPLMQLEMVARHKNKGTLERISEVKVSYHYNTIYNDMKKNAICIFISEILSFSLQEEQENIQLFNYIEYALKWLDLNDKTANFHISFLLGLTKHLGFNPDETNSNYPFFDLQEGVFFNEQPVTPYLYGEDIINFRKFLGINFDAISIIKLTSTQRQSLLNSVIMYFELHLHGFRKPKSLQVLSQVFH